MKRLGILGGTFDPIHNAHLHIAEQARVTLGLDLVLFIPNRVPAHKPADSVASAEHRVAMTRLAVAGNPAFRCSTIELERDGPSYTADTLAALRQDEPGAEIYFITGVDAIAEVETWVRPAEVLAQCRFVVLERPGFPLAALAARLSAPYMANITPLPGAQLDISATDLRRRVRAGEPIRYLTPDAVAEYIAGHGLYHDIGGTR